MNTNSTPTKSSIVSRYDKQAFIQQHVVIAPSLQDLIQVSCEIRTGGAIVTLKSDTPFEARVTNNQQRLFTIRLPMDDEVCGGYCMHIVLWPEQHITVQKEVV